MTQNRGVIGVTESQVSASDSKLCVTASHMLDLLVET